MLNFVQLIISPAHNRRGAIAFTAVLSLCHLAPAQAATFRISWTGQILGYSAEGEFRYDDSKTYENGIVRGDDLDKFDVAFYDPQGNLIQAFKDNHLNYPGFNFNFDTQTNEILQDGFFNEPNGVDIGEYTVLFNEEGEPIGATGLNFWSAAPAPQGVPIPHVHLTDFGNEFPDLPVGFGPHLDVSFFTLTRAELLGDPEAGDQIGQKMIATPVPESGALVGLGAIVLMTLRLRRKESL
ncbi:MAG: 2OG-Fe(II) oxygenase family protein [Cyanobacteria bacterium P01_H01_bin.15]